MNNREYKQLKEDSIQTAIAITNSIADGDIKTADLLRILLNYQIDRIIKIMNPDNDQRNREF